MGHGKPEMLTKRLSRGVWRVVEYMHPQLRGVQIRLKIFRVFSIHLRLEGTTGGIQGDREGELRELSPERSSSSGQGHEEAEKWQPV